MNQIQKFNEDYISYERQDSGLVDWSEEIPQAVKRQHKIDQILNDNLEDNLNNLGKLFLITDGITRSNILLIMI